MPNPFIVISTQGWQFQYIVITIIIILAISATYPLVGVSIIHRIMHFLLIYIILLLLFNIVVIKYFVILSCGCCLVGLQLTGGLLSEYIDMFHTRGYKTLP